MELTGDKTDGYVLPIKILGIHKEEFLCQNNAGFVPKLSYAYSHLFLYILMTINTNNVAIHSELHDKDQAINAFQSKMKDYSVNLMNWFKSRRYQRTKTKKMNK